MKNRKTLNIVLFLTYNLSIFDWKKLKILSRELELYKEHASKGNKISIISYGDKKDKRILNSKKINIFPIFEKNSYLSKFSKILFSISYIFKNHKKFLNCDIIKTNQILGAHLAIILKFLIKKKLVIRMGYEPYLQQKEYSPFSLKTFFLKFYCLFCYKFADHILISSKELKNEIIRVYNLKKHKISILPNFIDTKRFKNYKQKSKRNFFTISRFHEQKNLKFLFKEMLSINEKLYFYGPKKNSNEFLSYAKNINAKVEYLGLVDNSLLPMIINKYKFFILLSHIEGNPKALLEAMSCGKIIIASKVNGINNIIKDKKNGFLFNLKKDSLKEVFKKVQKSNLKNIQKNARKFVVLNHDINKIVDNENNIYKMIIKH